MKTLNTRAMIEGAILAALTAIMGIFYKVPILEGLTYFWPVPIIIVGYRNGFKVSIMAAVIAAIMIAIVINPIIGSILLFTYALPGAVMGNMLRKNKGAGSTIIVCGIILSLTIVLESILTMELVLGINIIEILTDLKGTWDSLNTRVYSQFAEIVETYRKLGMDEATLKEMTNSFQGMLKSVLLLLPSALLMLGMSISFINYKAVRFILGRMGYKIEDVKRITDWRLNPKYKFPLLAVTLLSISLMTTKNQIALAVFTNVWMVLRLIFLFFGISVVAFIIEKLKIKYEIPRAAHVTILLFMVLVCLPVLPYIGLFDMAADIRRLDGNTMGGAQ